MEEQRGSVLEDVDDELDADGKPKKNRVVTNKKDKPRVPLKSFGDNLNELFSTKKTVEPEKEDSVKPTPEAAHIEAEEAEVKSYPIEGLNGHFHDHEIIDLQLHELMENEQELPLNFSVIPRHRRDLEKHMPQELVERMNADKPDKEPTPHFFESLASPETSWAEVPPVVTEGSGGGNESPPHGPETPLPEPEPDPERQRQQNAATMAAIPASMRPELAQQSDTLYPNQQQPILTNERQEIRIVERHGGGALIAIVVDWFGRHGLRKELRSGQTKQDKQIEHIKQVQAETRRQQLRTNAEQASKEQQLWRDLTERPTTTELKAQHRYIPSDRLRPFESAPGSTAEKTSAPHKRNPEHIIEEQPVPLPPDHHLVRSEWHSIEVDKSGHPVETPTLAYGQEFKHEQHQEVRRQDELAAAGLAGSSAVNTMMGTNSLNSLTDDAIIQSPKSTVPIPISQRAAQTNDNSTDLWLWIILIVIILAIIASLILR